jgi:hypothetical protein
LITGILELKYDPEPERTFRKRRAAQKLATSSNLKTEEEPTTKAMRDEQSRDYCGKISIKQEIEWTPPHDNNSSEGIFWDDLTDIQMESEGDNFTDISKPFKEESWKPTTIPLDNKWKEHFKWIKKWMRLAPKSKFYVKRPYSAKRTRKIEYQQHVVREWLHISGKVFVEDYTQDEEVEALRV